MKISVVGTGCVGLVTGACFADAGHEVVCLDTDPESVAILQAGGCPIYEPGLLDILQRNITAGRLRFTTDVEAVVHHGILQFIAVGTPSARDGSVDLSSVMAAAQNIGRHMTEYRVVVDKSTVPPGTGNSVKAVIQEELLRRSLQLPFSVVSNPEFMREGTAVEDCMRPHRVIVGIEAGDQRAESLLREVYGFFMSGPDRFVLADIKSAELTKYAANAMLATRISFMNELANLAEKLGADIELVRRGIGSDPRIGSQMLQPGCGYGGSCFPKDVQALIQTARQEAGIELKILKAVEEVNHAQKHILFGKVKQRFGALSGKHFALWGLAFKPDTDDMRNAPSVDLINDLLAAGATICVHDPVALGTCRRLWGANPSLTYAESPIQALQGAEALIIVTEWKQYRCPDFAMMRDKLKQPVIFDGRNLWDPQLVRNWQFEYFPMGRS